MEQGILNKLQDKFILLTRDDLNLCCKNLPIEEIDITDFNRNKISREKLCKAIIVYFKDNNNKIKTFKNRYGYHNG